MADVGIVVVVGEVGIQGGVVEIDLGARVGGGLPGFLGGEHGCGEDIVGGDGLRGRGLACAVAFGGGRRGVGKGECPVVAVAADGADDFFAGDDLHGGAEVIFEPILAGDGTGCGVGLMLVVVHEDDAVGVLGEELEVDVVDAYDGNVDVKLEFAGVEVGVEGLDELVVAGSGVGWEALEVEGEAAVAGVGGQELVGLLDEAGAGVRVEKEGLDGGLKGAIGGVVVVHQGEDFGVFLGGGDGAENLVFAVDGVDGITLDDLKWNVISGVGGEGAVGGDDVEPLGEEEIDLFDVLLEGGVSGGIGVGVEGRAEAFALIEDDVGGFEVGLAMGGVVELFFGRKLGFWGVEGAVPAGGGAKVERPHGLHTDEADDKEDSQDGAEESHGVEDPAQALPAFALRVEEDLSVH